MAMDQGDLAFFYDSDCNDSIIINYTKTFSSKFRIQSNSIYLFKYSLLWSKKMMKFIKNLVEFMDFLLYLIFSIFLL